MPAKSFHTDHVDEAMSIWGRSFSRSLNGHRIAQAKTGRLGFALNTDSVGELTVATVRYATEVRAVTFGPRSFVAVPLAGAFRFDFGRTVMTANPTMAAIRTTDAPASIRGWSGGDESLLVLGFAPETLHDHLGRLLGRDPVRSSDFGSSLDLRAGLGAQWRELTRTMARALDGAHGLATHPMMAASMSSAVITGFLLSADHPYREQLDNWVRPVQPATVRRAVDYIEKHAHQPITVVDVAHEVGTGVRALQLSFKKHLGMSPLECIRRVRMDRAHDMLRSATPETASVAEIAQLWGFNQQGRFAGEYRKLYGVPPRVTLRAD